MEMMARSRAKCAACLRSETKRVQSNYPSVRRVTCLVTFSLSSDGPSEERVRRLFIRLNK